MFVQNIYVNPAFGLCEFYHYNLLGERGVVLLFCVLMDVWHTVRSLNVLPALTATLLGV